MGSRISHFLRNDEAATAVEYAVMLALVLMVVFSAISLLGTKTAQSWQNSNAQLQSVNFGS